MTAEELVMVFGSTVLFATKKSFRSYTTSSSYLSGVKWGDLPDLYPTRSDVWSKTFVRSKQHRRAEPTTNSSAVILYGNPKRGENINLDGGMVSANEEIALASNG